MSIEHDNSGQREFLGGSNFTVYRPLVRVFGIDIIEAPSDPGAPLIILGEKVNATRFLSETINQITNKLAERSKK